MLINKFHSKFVCLAVALLSLCLAGCQREWSLKHEMGMVQGAFPNEVTTTQEAIDLPNGHTLHFTQWSSQIEASTFTLNFTTIEGADAVQTRADALSLIKSMPLKRLEGHQDKRPDIGEVFTMYAQLPNGAFLITGKVLQKNNRIAQAYVAGQSSPDLLEQAKRFLESIKLD